MNISTKPNITNTTENLNIKTALDEALNRLLQSAENTTTRFEPQETAQSVFKGGNLICENDKGEMREVKHAKKAGKRVSRENTTSYALLRILINEKTAKGYLVIAAKRMIENPEEELSHLKLAAAKVETWHKIAKKEHNELEIRNHLVLFTQALIRILQHKDLTPAERETVAKQLLETKYLDCKSLMAMSKEPQKYGTFASNGALLAIVEEETFTVDNRRSAAQELIDKEDVTIEALESIERQSQVLGNKIVMQAKEKRNQLKV